MSEQEAMDAVPDTGGSDVSVHDALAALEELETVGQDAWWTTTHALTMSLAVLVFGIVVILTIAYLIQKGRRPDELLRIFGTSLIIIMAIFLVVAGYSDEQMSPVMGLLGTIVGYLLGKGAREPEAIPGPSEKPSGQSQD